MYHIFKDDRLTHLQEVIEAPSPHIVPAQATISAQTVNRVIGLCMFHRFIRQCFRSTYFRLIGHLQAIGHVTGKTYVQNGCTYTTALHDVYYPTDERSRLPGKSGTGLQDKMQMGIPRLQALQQTDEMFHIIVLPSHQMPAPQIEPFQLRETTGEFLLQMLKRMFKLIGNALTMTMTMKSFDSFR